MASIGKDDSSILDIHSVNCGFNVSTTLQVKKWLIVSSFWEHDPSLVQTILMSIAP